MPQKHAKLSGAQTYHIPSYRLVKIDGVFLIIAPDSGNWIVLQNELQYKIFTLFSNGLSIAQILEQLPDCKADLIPVLTQLEAKQFCTFVPKMADTGQTLQLHVTNKCNLSCSHCYMRSGTALEGELTLSEIQSLFQNFKSVGGVYVTLTGGELSTRTDICDILHAARNIGLTPIVLSNGLDWSDEFFSAVCDAKPSRVQISIDGYDEESYVLVRGRRAFHEALSTVDRLLAQDIPVQVSVTPAYQVAIEHSDELIRFISDLNARYSNKLFSAVFSYELLPGRALSKNFVDKINSDYRSAIEKIDSALTPDSDLESFAANFQDGEILNNCGYGRLNVAANGDVYFCSQFENVNTYANIRTHSFEAIWALACKARTLSDISHLRPCRDCELRYICGGGCRIKSFPALGRIHDLSLANFDTVPARSCDSSQKERIYRQMILANPKLYR